MKMFVQIDADNRIISAADEGFHLGENEVEADFADDLVQDGHVEIYDDRMIPMYELIDGAAVARSQEAMDAEWTEPIPEPDLSAQVAELRESNRQLQEALDLLLSGEVE